MSKNARYLITSVIMAFFAIIISEILIDFISGRHSKQPNVEIVESTIQEEFLKAEEYACQYLKKFQNGTSKDIFKCHFDSLNLLIAKENIAIFLYKDSQLSFWSENIDVTDIKPDSSKRHIYKIQNSWFLGQWIVKGDYSALVLSRLMNEYPYQNKFLKNSYSSRFKNLANYSISDQFIDSALKVKVDEGSVFYLLELKNSVDRISSVFKLVFQVVSLFLLILSLQFLFSLNLLKNRTWLKLVGFPLSVFIIRMISIAIGFPEKSFGVLFGPGIYAHTIFNPSFGDYIINAVLIFWVSVFIYRNTRSIVISDKDKTNNLMLCLSSLILWLTYFLTDRLFGSLVLHSTINLETFRIFNLSTYSVLGYCAISLWIGSTILLCHRWISVFHNQYTILQLTVCALITYMIVLLLFFLNGAMPSLYGMIWAVISFGLIFIVSKRSQTISTSFFLILIVLLSFYSVFLVSDFSYKKDREVRKILAINLSSERDPVAEMLFPGLEVRLKKDTTIYKYVRDIHKHDFDMYRYLQETYFNSYFKKYDLQATVCFPGSEIITDNTNYSIDCEQFYYGIIKDLGIKISGSLFYFINNQNGRISYIGIIKLSGLPDEVKLYIELESKLSRELLGYPELLLEGKLTNKTILSSFSTAKYHKNQLIAQTGTFPYRLQSSFELDSVNQFNYINQNKYNHLVYRSDKDNIVVISRPRENLLNTTVSFTYVFIFFLLITLLWVKLAGFPVNIRSNQPSFRNRIKVAMILIIFLSLILVAIVTIGYNIQSFENKSRENLSEKLMSVLVEIERDFSDEDILYPQNGDFISNRLVQISNIFYTDINLYNARGILFATSRPEIFERQLLGKQMNPRAWYEMHFLHNPKLIHKEEIGSMSYLSAYVPLVDLNNKVIAYLNLPYFTRQSEFIRDLYSVIVAIINIYALLTLITIAIAMIISNQISKPLELIMENLSKVDITKLNEPIRYESNDELGRLVKEYNRVVFELAESAEKLAKSQRESAWREMAKQIAHEIKNPLTPIKLNLQHLVKAKREGVADWDARFDKFSSNLVDQITALSAIATEFSDFAKMPVSNVSEVNLNAVLDEIIALFAGYSNIKISFHNKAGKVIVNADREQLFRVFVNLVKNAIQSIDVRKRGEISISMSHKDDKCLIAVKDNGKGIPVDLRPRMFSPNFTTKSGGMGLGLAIVKGIVESLNGKVWFDTESGAGSTFYVEIPSKKKPD